MHKFTAVIDIIGINPFVFVPEKVLKGIFKQAGKSKGHIPVHGTVNGKTFRQTLIRYSGHWRLYINTTMLKDSPKKIGERIRLTLAFDPAERTIKTHPRFSEALKTNPEAKEIFHTLSPSRQKEIIRYISFLKTEESVERNIQKAIDFLLGKARFVGRDKP